MSESKVHSLVETERDAYGRAMGRNSRMHGALTSARDRRQVVVAVDDSPAARQAVRYAALLARGAPPCELHLLNVQPFVSPDPESGQLAQWGLAIPSKPVRCWTSFACPTCCAWLQAARPR